MRFHIPAIATLLAGFAIAAPLVAAPLVAAPLATANAQALPQTLPAQAPVAGQGDDTRGPGPHRPGPMGEHGMGRAGQGMGQGMDRGMGPMHRAPIDPSLFALMYRPDDRQLTPPDVQKIAESILLWFGNRTWKVTGVAPAGDGQIAFAFATADGSTIARFTMDTKNGRVVRTG